MRVILESITAIEAYLNKIKSADDFKNTFEGNKTLDAVMMRLQSVGENIKKINKIDAAFFESLLIFDTNNIIRFRDFISLIMKSWIVILFLKYVQMIFLFLNKKYKPIYQHTIYKVDYKRKIWLPTFIFGHHRGVYPEFSEGSLTSSFSAMGSK